MKNHLLFSALAVALLFGACRKSELQPAAPITQESIDEIAKKKNCNDGKDLKGSMAFTVAEGFDLACDCGAFMSAGTYYGVGNISHLGKTTSHFKPCIAPIFNGNVLVGYHVGVQCGYLKAANGDVVNVSIQPYNLMFTNTGAVGTVNVTITGGTGKFKHASGKFTAGTTNDGMGNVTLDNIKGKIKY